MCAGRQSKLQGLRGSFPEVQEVFKMKALILLAILAAVVSIAYWRVRKADAEKDLARRKAANLRNSQRKDAITSENHVEWPVMVRTVTGNPGSEAEDEIPEPTMTAIEVEFDYEPAEQAKAQG